MKKTAWEMLFGPEIAQTDALNLKTSCKEWRTSTYFIESYHRKVNALCALQKKIETHLSVVSSLFDSNKLHQETASLTLLHESISQALAPSLLEDIYLLDKDIQTWDKNQLSPFMENQFLPYENAFIDNLHNHLKMDNQRQCIELFLEAIITHSFEYFKHCYSKKPKEQIKLFNQLFHGIAQIRNGHAVFLFKNQFKKSGLLLYWLNKLIRRARSQFRFSYNVIQQYMNAHKNTFIIRADLTEKKHLLRNNELKLSIDHETNCWLSEETLRIKIPKQVDVFYIKQNVISFKERIDEIALNIQNINSRSFKDSYQTSMKASRVYLNTHYPAPFLMKRVSSIFHNNEPTSYDYLCSHYYQKIHALISFRKHWLFTPSFETSELLSKNERFPPIFKSLIKILSKQDALLEEKQTRLSPSTLEKWKVKSESAKLILIKHEVCWLTACLDTDQNLTDNSLQAICFIQLLARFLSSPLPNADEPSNWLDDYFQAVMATAPQKKTLAMPVVCMPYKEPETLQLSKK